MKQRKVVSMIGALVVIISAVVLITGCSQPNNNSGNISNNGGYSGNTGNNGSNTGNNGGSTGNNGGNTGNGGSSTTTQRSAVYEYTKEESGVTYRYTITFNTDGTYMQRTNEADGGVEAVVEQGIYTGDASKDGTISMTVKKVHNGTALVDYTGQNATHSVNIAGGKFTLGPIQYTRK